jgi:hypothetical protein
MPTTTTAAATAATTTKTRTKITTLTTTLRGSHLHITIIVPITKTNNQYFYATNTIASGTTTTSNTGGHFSRRMGKIPAKGVNWLWKFLWEDQFTSTVASACYMIRR